MFAAAFALWALLLTRAASGRLFAGSRSSASASHCSRSSAGERRPHRVRVFPFVSPGPGEIACAGPATCPAAALPLAAWAVHNGVRFDTGRSPAAATRSSRSTARSSPTASSRPRTARAHVDSLRDARAPGHARSVRSYGVTLDGVFETGASGSTRTSTSCPTRSSAGTPTTGSSAKRYRGVRATRACTPAAWPDGLAGALEGAIPVVRRRRSASDDKRPTVVVNGKRLPAPTEGEPIPSGQIVWISRPDNSIRQVWTSPTE